MLFFLQILGGLVLSLLVLFAAGCLYVFSKYGKYLKLDDLTSKEEPLLIHLNEELEPSWLNEKKVVTTIDKLKSLGFERGKAYSIYEMPSFSLLVFFKSPMVAVLYHHDVVGNWYDLVVQAADGTEYTITNAAIGDNIKKRPDKKMKYLPQANFEKLLNSIDKVIANNGPFDEIDPDNIRELIETSYKKDIAFRLRNGGLSFEEFEAEIKNSSIKSTAKEIETGYIDCKFQELEQWHCAALEEYRVKENIDEEKFYDIQHRLLIIPFKSNPIAFVHYLAEQCFLSNSQEEQFLKVAEQHKDVGELFSQIIETLSPGIRPKFLKSLDYPLPLKIFEISERMFHQH